MSMLNARKNNKKVVRLKFMQPQGLWSSYTLKDVAEDGLWSGYIGPAWKSLDGRDVKYYFKKRDELSELFLSMTNINCRNYYIDKLNNIQLHLQEMGMELNKVYTDIVPNSKRAKTFMPYTAPSIEVDK